METRLPKDLDDTTSLWHKCTGCQEFVFKNELERNRYICSSCGALFPLLADKRLEYLLDDVSTAAITPTEESGVIADGSISGYPACVFISDIDVIPEDINASFFLSAIERALQKRIPLITITACQPSLPNTASIESTYLTLQLTRLADLSLPHITVFTEIDEYPLTTNLPVGELVIAEGAAPSRRSGEPNLQPALHAPEEQLLTQPLKIESKPNLGVDCYVGREELPSRLGLFMKFFHGA